MDTQKLDLAASLIIRNAKKANVEKQTPADAVFSLFLAAMNMYLHLLRAEDVENRKYEDIKTALQDITGWFIMGLDIETFEMREGFEPRKMIVNVETEI